MKTTDFIFGVNFVTLRMSNFNKKGAPKMKVVVPRSSYHQKPVIFLVQSGDMAFVPLQV